MSDEDTLLDYISGLSDDALVAMYCDFNAWEWPEVLPEEFRPKWWSREDQIGGRRVIERKYGFSEPFMNFVEARFSEERLNKAWQDRYGQGG